MVKNIAHRGFSASYPENTLLAFQKALDTECDGVELDIHLSKDGELAVIHDEDIRRTTDGQGLVGELTMAELKRYDAGSGQQIPTLEEYFDLIADRPFLTNIELKNSVIWYDGMEEQLIALIRKRNLEERVLLSSFNHYSMEKCKQLAPDIKCGLLCSCWIVDAGAYTKRLGMECIHPNFYSLTPDTVAEIHRNGIEINTWTIDGQAETQRAVELGVASIITNNPVLVGEAIAAL